MTLGGLLFIKDGVKYDYCFEQSIICLQELCDQVCILAIQSDDGTTGLALKYQNEKTLVVCLDEIEWEKQHGREKLAYFQNLALSFLDTDYYFLLQGDEIVHEKSFPAIREAIQTNQEAFLCHRLNLWRDCMSYLNVPIERQPCNTQVIRLAKIKYKSVGDGESIEAFANDDFLSQIRIYHMGFVRDKKVMKDKIKNMQSGVFQIDYDPKLDNMDVFDWNAWFRNEDLSPIKEKLPFFIQEWAKTRP
jgi:hypothetical protein